MDEMKNINITENPAKHESLLKWTVTENIGIRQLIGNIYLIVEDKGNIISVYATIKDGNEYIPLITTYSYGFDELSKLYNKNSVFFRDLMQSLEVYGIDTEQMREAIKEAAKNIQFGNVPFESKDDRTRKDIGDDSRYIKEDYFEGNRFMPSLVADKILEEHHIVTTRDTEEIWVYHEELGIYKNDGKTFIKEIAKEKLGDESRINRLNEIINDIRIRTYIDRDELGAPDGIIVLKNGTLDIFTRRFYPHSPAYMAIVALPIEYVSTTDCPEIKKFLKEILHKNDIPIIQELSGYFLLRDNRFQKAYMFLGDGANGKSTLVNLFKTFLGSNNITSISLYDLTANRFAQAQLFGKLANLFADLPDRALRYTGTFKIMTGGDPYDAEVKHQQNRLSFTNYAIPVFSANKTPEVNDDSVAFWRRWKTITFPNQFLGINANPKKIEEITTPGELSGFLNFALEGLDRLLKNGQFSGEETTDQTSEKWKRAGDSVYCFLEDCTEIDANSTIPKDELYSAFITYCTANNLPSKAKNAFSMKIFQYCPNISVKRIGTKYRTYCWNGIKLKVETDNQEDEEYENYVEDVHTSTSPSSAGNLGKSNSYGRGGVPRRLDILDVTQSEKRSWRDKADDEEELEEGVLHG